VTAPRKRTASRAVAGVAIAGTVLIAMGAFSLSFTALTHLALDAGIGPKQAWEWPVIVDGVIVVATVAVVALRRQKGSAYAWMLLFSGALVSVAANAVQAGLPDHMMPRSMAAAVAAVPPIVLLAITHLTVILTHRQPSQPADGPSRDLPARLPALDTPSAEAAPDPGVQEAPAQAAAQESDAAGVSDVFWAVPDEAKEPQASPGAKGSGGREVSRTWQKERVSALRAEGWSIQQIADELGIHATTVSRWLKQQHHDEPEGADHE